jgi:aminoglycoside phosphotransferase (APT) family kinase protein
VLEDLSERTRPGDQIAGCSVAEAEAVARELAALHAAFWDDARLDTADWLYNRAAGAQTAAVTNALAAKSFRERFAARADPALLDAIDIVVTDLPRHFSAIPKGRTLVHGEPRVDNVLFEDGAARPKAWLIDWQFADRGSPMFDLAYFLSGSLSPEDRRSIDKRLVEQHHAAIAAKDPAYTLEQARAEFAGSLPQALYFTVGAILAMPPSEHGDLLLLTLAERNVAALRDWGVV